MEIVIPYPACFQGRHKKLKELFGSETDYLCYDITSTHFEGKKCIIARLGYSGDGKSDKLQVNIGLVVTKEERFPVFHLVFVGNETDIFKKDQRGKREAEGGWRC